MGRRTLAVAVGWTVLIVVGCVIPLGGAVERYGAWVLDHDGLVHALLFFVFAWTTLPVLKGPLWRKVVLVTSAGLLLGGAMELVQAVLPWERGANAADFTADAVGLAAGVVVYGLVAVLRARRD